MTPKPDDRLVDPRVADAWREASSEEPPASVDDAILAAARREVSARPETLSVWEAREARASRRRWWPLAAAATVAAIAVGVVQLTPTDELASSSSETARMSDVPPPAARPDAKETAPSSAATAPAPATPAPSAAPVPSTPDPFPARRNTASDTAAATGEVAAAPAPPLPAAGRSRTESAAKVPRESDSVARQSSAVPAVAAPAAPLAKMAAAPDAESGVTDARQKDRKPLPVAEWIALIRRLRAEGKADEAARELTAFRAAHADHEKLLPPDLRDWRPPQK